MYFQPKRVAVTAGYPGFPTTVETYKRSRNAELPVIGIDDEFQAGDLCWLETPLNPTGEARYVLTFVSLLVAVIGGLHRTYTGISSTMLTRLAHRPQSA